jgi:hypothetical protein
MRSVTRAVIQGPVLKGNRCDLGFRCSGLRIHRLITMANCSLHSAVFGWMCLFLDVVHTVLVLVLIVSGAVFIIILLLPLHSLLLPHQVHSPNLVFRVQGLAFRIMCGLGFGG